MIELAIVILIVGLIAAMAIPKLSRGTRAADNTSLRATLRTLRSAIHHYALEHKGRLPGADGVSATFWNQLTHFTDANGVWTGPRSQRPFGPYVGDKVEVPVGPNKGAHILLMTINPPLCDEVSEAQSGKGWVYNYQTGVLYCSY